eukprot:snap_masked-scaffold_30-processed-gene-3.96-mRNA-1 protein AED:0.47 eAED:0.47 QI:0/-1/0/1/-1/1/1/0/173
MRSLVGRRLFSKVSKTIKELEKRKESEFVKHADDLAVRPQNTFDKYSYAIEAETRPGQVSITSYGSNTFRINKQVYKGNLILFPDFFFSWKLYSSDSFSSEDFAIFKLAKPTPDLLIIGTGKTLKRPEKKLLEELENFTSVEILNSRQASATFNMLNAEERNVAAAILSFSRE